MKSWRATPDDGPYNAAHAAPASASVWLMRWAASRGPCRAVFGMLLLSIVVDGTAHLSLCGRMRQDCRLAAVYICLLSIAAKTGAAREVSDAHSGLPFHVRVLLSVFHVARGYSFLVCDPLPG